MQMHDVLGRIYTNEDFADLFPKDGQPAEAPWRLALVTVMQFVENLSDQQAADAVRGRLDWKYLLGLELTDPGFDASVLSEFRARLINQHAEERLLEKMLTLFQQKGWRNRARSPAHRFDACPGQDPRPQSSVMCLGNDACGAQQSCGGCSRLAARPQSSRMGGALWTAQ